MRLKAERTKRLERILKIKRHARLTLTMKPLKLIPLIAVYLLSMLSKQTCKHPRDCWPVEKTNLSELHEPFLKMVGELAEAGRQTARVMYGSRGNGVDLSVKFSEVVNSVSKCRTADFWFVCEI